MHDAKKRELKVGDTVLIPCRVREVQAQDNHCNVTVDTLGGRIPDGQTECVTLNTAQLYRANQGDDTEIHVAEVDGKRYLR
jgi:hypothetical protein